MEISKNNNIINHDLIEGKKTLKLKIYDYFFNMLSLRKEPNFITLYIYHTMVPFIMVGRFSPTGSVCRRYSTRHSPLCYMSQLK